MQSPAWSFVAFCLTLYIGPIAQAAGPAPEMPSAGFQIKAENSDAQRGSRKLQEPYKGEIIDALSHLEEASVGSKHLKVETDPVEAIRKAGIGYGILMPTPNEGLAAGENATHSAVEYARRSKGHLMALCGGDYLSDWIGRAQDRDYNRADWQLRLDRLDADLANPGCAGVGELGFMHFDKKLYQNVIHIRGNFGPMLDVVAAVAKSGKWLQLHAEAVEPNGTRHEEESFRALALWYQMYPDLKVVMSHTAMTNAFNARQLLRLYPHLMMSIKIKPKSESWEHLEPITNRKGELYNDWAKLMEDFPQRFMVGTDTKFDTELHHSGDKYEHIVAQFRDILGSLNPQTAHAVASGNAHRIYGIGSGS